MSAECLLGYEDRRQAREYPCETTCCTTCGFNSEERKRRLETIRNGGLKKNDKGLYFLPVERLHASRFHPITEILEQETTEDK